MGISVDISLYPMTPDYKAPIIQFIEKIKSYESIEVLTNPLSTQVYGQYDEVWSILGKELKASFGSEVTQIAVLKIVSIDVNG